ncbi:hypothetical protein M5K25_012282 [Dendrobium thyrsiflorum]|uniref:Uncharacterized protein n=1 Tax=Dendrobium thyrsiflorum TaxID=117978 RepID=A0ABD0V4D1_DENTH
MVDPELDHRFVFNSQGRIDVLRSPFFDVNLEIDHTVEEYIDRIFFSSTTAIDEYHIPIQWQILRRPPIPSFPVNFSLDETAIFLILLFSSSLFNPPQLVQSFRKSFATSLYITSKHEMLEDLEVEATKRRRCEMSYALHCLDFSKKVLEGKMENLKAIVEERYSDMEERLSSIESCFKNMEDVMRKLIEMQSKASPAVSRSEPKGKEILEDNDEVKNVFHQGPPRGLCGWADRDISKEE